ncbi:MAG: PQQ-dependent sugar dehydrogenase, partial [Bacteroidota bacterium]
MIGNAKLLGAGLLGVLSIFLLSSIGFVSSAPPGAIDPYIDGIFPEITPGFGGSWYLENAFPEVEVAAPVKVINFPSGDDLLVLCKTGRLWRINPETRAQTLILDITDRTVNYSEAGSVSVALHPAFGDPAFPDKQLAFVFYRYKPEPEVQTHLGYNRLSKFAWDASAQRFVEDSEEILIQQYDRNAWHNGGGLFFKDGLLYLALGDEGGPEFRNDSNQRLDRGLFSGLIRIDVDNDPSRSHPIRRQPVANAAPPEGWPTETYTQGYSIPNDNPWQSEAGDILEEFYAIGIRSPYSTHFDAEDRS